MWALHRLDIKNRPAARGAPRRPRTRRGPRGDRPEPPRTSVTLRAPNRMRRGRVVTRMRWIQGRATVTYLYGMSRSSDAVDAHSRHNPQGRASFAASRRCSGSTGRQARRQRLQIPMKRDLETSPSRLGLRQNTLRRGASHSVSGSYLPRPVAVWAGVHCGNRPTMASALLDCPHRAHKSLRKEHRTCQICAATSCSRRWSSLWV